MKKYRISRIRELSPSTMAFTFEPVDDPIDYIPGQFLFLNILNDKGESVVRRPYSIASAPGQELELCIKLVKGNLTGKLEHMKEGDLVGIYNGETKCGLIAGGTGISPMLSILRHAAAKKIKGDFTLFFSARSRGEIMYESDLRELDENPNIKIVITLTREDWEGEKGRICHPMIGKYAPDAKERTWWICGPLGMIKAMKECLLELGVDPRKIKIEGWG